MRVVPTLHEVVGETEFGDGCIMLITAVSPLHLSH